MINPDDLPFIPAAIVSVVLWLIFIFLLLRDRKRRRDLEKCIRILPERSRPQDYVQRDLEARMRIYNKEETQ